MTYECDSCDREFYSWNAVRQHMTALEHWQWPYECDTCERRFGSQDAVNQHMNALDHWSASSEEEDDDEFECDKCDRTFSSWEGCKQHMTNLNHWFTDVCDTCDRRFVNRTAVEQHMDALGHRSSHYCSRCERHFQNPSDLFQHMNSPIHVRTDPIHAAPAPPARTTPIPQSASTVVHAPTVPVPSTPAANPSPLPSADAQPSVSSLPTANQIPASVLNQALMAALAVVSAQSASPILPSTQPTNTGTLFAPFSVFIESDNATSTNSHYQSITFMQHYQTFSFEELRLADYRAGRSPIYTSQQTGAFAQHTDSRTDVSSSDGTESSFFTAAAGSRTSTPSIFSSSNAESHTAMSSATTTVHMQENLTALTAEDNAKFDLVYEAHARVTKLVRSNENESEWISQGVGPIRILASKDTFAPRVLMRAEPSGKVGLDLDVLLGSTFHDIKAPKMLHLNALTKDNKKIETSMCVFKDESEAKEFLNKLHKATAKAHDSSADHSSFSLSEIPAQQTEPVAKSEIVNCPFCPLGCYTVSEVLQHLETTSCRARPDLNRDNIYYHLHQYDTHGHLTESFSDTNVSVPRTEEFLYHCPDTTGKCRGKLLPSFAALHAHLEGESCEFKERSDLLQNIRNIENWVPTFGSC
ncbi:hypothetical protein KCU98_g7212, partial [Aureobasidium melanogenum]